MRIAIDARLMSYSEGGISEYIEQLSSRLPRYDLSNNYLILQSFRNNNRITKNNNSKTIKCFTPPHHKLEKITLTTEIIARRINILHSPDFIPPYNGGWKSVITVHDLAFLIYPQFLTDNSQKYYNHQIHDAVKRSDAILADSESTRNDILNYLNVKPEKVTTIHLAPNDLFTPQSTLKINHIRKTLNLPDEYILFVGTFEPRKNIDGLLKAYSNLLSLKKDIPPLVIVGREGWRHQPIEKIICELHLEHHTKLIHNANRCHMPSIYSGALTLVLPSHYEGFGLPVLESMACGTATIVSNRGSLPEIAEDASLIIDPDDTDSISDAILTICENSDLRKTLQQLGLSQVSKFTWEKCCQDTIRTYKNLISE